MILRYHIFVTEHNALPSNTSPIATVYGRNARFMLIAHSTISQYIGAGHASRWPCKYIIQVARALCYLYLFQSGQWGNPIPYGESR